MRKAKKRTRFFRVRFSMRRLGKTFLLRGQQERIMGRGDYYCAGALSFFLFCFRTTQFHFLHRGKRSLVRRGKFEAARFSRLKILSRIAQNFQCSENSVHNRTQFSVGSKGGLGEKPIIARGLRLPDCARFFDDAFFLSFAAGRLKLTNTPFRFIIL